MKSRFKIIRKLEKLARKNRRRYRRLFFSWLQPRIIRVQGVGLPADPEVIPGEVLKLLYEGQYEKEEALLCRQVLRQGDRVLELGGGIGFISSLCAQICGSDNVLTYEANALVQPVIQETHKINGVTPQLRMQAIGVTCGKAQFFVNENIISSSLVDRKFGGGVAIDCDGLSEVIDEFRPTVIICDIEGAEADILPSADLTSIDRLIIELHPKIIGYERNEELIETLEARGLHLISGRKEKVALFARSSSAQA